MRFLSKISRKSDGMSICFCVKGRFEFRLKRWLALFIVFHLRPVDASLDCVYVDTKSNNE